MSDSLELHFDYSNRAWALGQLKAYVQGVQNKLIASFENIEEEAEAFAEAEYERMGSQPGCEDGPDLADIAETAHDRSVLTSRLRVAPTHAG